MHVLHWIAVNGDADGATDKEEALSYVQNQLEDMLTDNGGTGFFDWFVAGGGRWNVSNGNWMSAYDEGKTNMIISYETDPDLFEERVLQSCEARKAEFDRYVADMKPELLNKVVTDYNPRENNFEITMDIYPIKKIIDMAYGIWDSNAYFYDISNWSTSTKYMFESIDKGNKEWYLVPVDFHF